MFFSTALSGSMEEGILHRWRRLHILRDLLQHFRLGEETRLGQSRGGRSHRQEGRRKEEQQAGETSEPEHSGNRAIAGFIKRQTQLSTLSMVD